MWVSLADPKGEHWGPVAPTLCLSIPLPLKVSESASGYSLYFEHIKLKRDSYMFFASECTKQTSAPCTRDAVNNQSLSKERTVMDNFQWWSGKIQVYRN